MTSIKLPEDFTGWSFSVAPAPNLYLGLRRTGTEDFVDISDSIDHFTLVDPVSQTIEVAVRRFTDATAQHLEEILQAVQAWKAAPKGVVAKIEVAISKINLSMLKDALELIEYVIKLLIEYGGPVLDVLQAIGWDKPM